MERYPSPILFHGPGAEQAAMAKVSAIGRLLHEPFGQNNLKIAESREISELMINTPVGDIPGVLVVGPMDRAGKSAQDVLLKTIEEFDERRVRPVFWAHDEAEVLPTIRSRCILQWCPGELVVDEGLVYQARAAVDCFLAADTAGVIEALKDQDPRGMLEATTKVLSELEPDRDILRLWDRMREVLGYNNPTPTEVLAAFL